MVWRFAVILFLSCGHLSEATSKFRLRVSWPEVLGIPLARRIPSASFTVASSQNALQLSGTRFETGCIVMTKTRYAATITCCARDASHGKFLPQPRYREALGTTMHR